VKTFRRYKFFAEILFLFVERCEHFKDNLRNIFLRPNIDLVCYTLLIFDLPQTLCEFSMPLAS